MTWWRLNINPLSDSEPLFTVMPRISSSRFILPGLTCNLHIIHMNPSRTLSSIPFDIMGDLHVACASYLLLLRVLDRWTQICLMVSRAPANTPNMQPKASALTTATFAAPFPPAALPTSNATPMISCVVTRFIPPPIPTFLHFLSFWAPNPKRPVTSLVSPADQSCLG
ncbi:hypothetical protein BD779DRAFT_1582595 [Infundibulicybe gibba]|nr:hypothetical protein BD779DRAFT_1582595 [Infundibulicybe gibba]